MWLLTELRRRNVFRVAVAYLAASWLLVQVVDTFVPAFGLPNGLIRLVSIALLIGFPLVLLFSWIYELTPEGLKLEKDVDRAASIVKRTGQSLDKAIIVILAIALGYFAVDKFLVDPLRDAKQLERATELAVEKALAEAEESTSGRSIVVLPFVDLSPRQDQEYLSDGFSEELMNLLVQIPNLRVISRASAFSFKNKAVDLPTIADQLNVARALTGSIRRYGDKVRITAQLIDARKDSSLWSGSYDRTIDDIFELQEQLANLVVRELRVSLMGHELVTSKTDATAYTLFLQAGHLTRQGTDDSWRRSNELLQRVLAIDPEYAPGWSMLAGNYIKRSTVGALDMAEGFELARDAANRALAINHNFAPALSYLGWISMYLDDDLQTAARYYERALELESSSDLISNASTVFQNLGRIEQAIDLRKWAIEHDPVSANKFSMLGNAYLDAGLPDDAIQAFKTSLTLSPDFMGSWYGIGVAYLMLGDSKSALESFKSEIGDEEYRVKGMALAHYELGNTAEFEELFAQLKEKWGDDWPSEIAHVYAWTGDADAAFYWLDTAIEVEVGLAEQFLLPFFVPIHDDPRWLQFRERTGSAQDQLDSIEFNVVLPKDLH